MCVFVYSNVFRLVCVGVCVITVMYIARQMYLIISTRHYHLHSLDMQWDQCIAQCELWTVYGGLDLHV